MIQIENTYNRIMRRLREKGREIKRERSREDRESERKRERQRETEMKKELCQDKVYTGYAGRTVRIAPPMRQGPAGSLRGLHPLLRGPCSPYGGGGRGGKGREVGGGIGSERQRE
jgi:hypothetical protein